MTEQKISDLENSKIFFYFLIKSESINVNCSVTKPQLLGLSCLVEQVPRIERC